MACWKKVTDNAHILSWLEGYKIPFHSKPYCLVVPNKVTQSATEKHRFESSISSLLKIGAISKCSHKKGEFISSVFLVPKPNGQDRFILNLKGLNKFVRTLHFKMEDYRTASKLITKYTYMGTIDMKDAYFLVSVHESHRKYLRFKLNGILYEFNCLPFGLSTSPFVFTKILKPVAEYLRSRHMISVYYLDDIFCIGRTYAECFENIKLTLNLLENLGFIINYEKSSLVPKMQCKFLGFIFDSVKMTITLPEEKRIKIEKSIKKFAKLKYCKLREFAKLLGLLTSACPAVDYGMLHTRSLERHKYLCLENNPNYNQIIDMPYTLQQDLHWWAKNIHHAFTPLRFQNYRLEIFSDASTTGWGAYCNGKKAYGHWKIHENNLHINILELKAALFALKIYGKNHHDCEILLRIDNVTAISCINKKGSIRFPHLNDITKDIWVWCEQRKIMPFASYINTKDNINADKLSRYDFADTEWELNHDAFMEIVRKFGQPKLDLFASRSNAKCKCYVSWKRDPDAWAIDAFTLSWSELDFYAFPPFSMILKMLQKIIHDKAEGIVVVPHWPSQPWYPLFMKLVHSEIIYFSPHKTLLISPFRLSHNLQKSLTLVAARLYGKSY